MALDAASRWAIKTSIMALINGLANDGSALDAFVETVFRRQMTTVPADTGVILAESCSVYREAGRADTAVGTVFAGDTMNVWRSLAVDGATWYFVDNGSDIAGWIHADWIDVTAGSATTDYIAETYTRGLVVNFTGADSDTRISGDTDTYLVQVDAGTDRVGIGVAAPSSKLDVNGDIEIVSTGAVLLGDPTTDGSWRMVRSGNNLQVERRESGAWVAKGVFTP